MVHLIRPRWLIVVLAAFVLAACSPPEQRAAEFVAKARQLYEAGNFEAAALEARNAVQVQPKNAEAHFLLAQIYEKEGKLNEVVSNLLVVVDIDPKNLEAQVKLGTLFFYGKVYDQATSYAEAAAKLAPEDSGVRLLQARLAFQKEQVADGMRLLDAVLQREPGNLDALGLKAMAMAQTDHVAALAFVDEALKTIELAKAQSLRRIRLGLLDANQPELIEKELLALASDYPDETDYPVQLADLYRRLGRVDDAEKVIRQFIEKRPDDVDARLGLVRFLAAARSPEVGEETLKKFIAEKPDVPQFRQALGKRYEATGRTAEAIEIYRQLAASDPKSVTGLAARREIAKIAFREGRIEDGRAEIDAVLTDSPDDPDALVMRAGLRFDAGQYADVIADLRAALRRQPEAQAALLMLARTYAISGDGTLAVDTYRRLLEVNPQHAEAPGELAPLLAARGDLAAAAEVLERRLAAAPEDLVSLGRLAEIRIREGDGAAAEALARRMINVKGQNGLGEFELGRALQAQSRRDAAISAFRASLAQRPDDTVVLESLSQSLSEAGKGLEAVREVKAYIARRPQDANAKYLLGNLLARSGDAAAARVVYDEAIALQPKVAVYYTALSRVEATPEARIEALRRGVAALPGDPGVAVPLGEEYERAQRHTDAIQVYEALLAKNPAIAAARNNLAALLLDHRSDPESHQRALELATPFMDSSDPLYLDTLGWALYRNGNYVQAVSTLERAVAAAGERPEIRYHLGMAYLKSNDLVGARRELSQAVGEGKTQFAGLAAAREALAGISQLEGSTK